MCGTHYQKWRLQAAKAECAVSGCESDVYCRAWCSSHYRRWKAYGDPTYIPPKVLPPQNLPRTFGCTESGCEGDHFAHGLCKSHYNGVYYGENRAELIDRFREYRSRPESREEARSRTKAWREANPERARFNWNKRQERLSSCAISDLTLEQWQDIKDAWDHRCAYCGCTPEIVTMDHYVPIARGGNHTASNIVPACMSCNARKHDGPPPPFYYELTA